MQKPRSPSKGPLNLLRALVTCVVTCTAVQSALAEAPASPMILGVQTHFSQGWPLSRLDLAENASAVALRDSVRWAVAEKTRGVYDFSAPNAAYVASVCAKSHNVLLTIPPENPLYEDGQTAFSEEARQAYANYLVAVVDHFSGCVSGIEIGNEINGGRAIKGPAATDKAASYVALLKTVFQVVKPGHPNLQLLGGSTNVIGTGFLEKLFAAGMLDYVDGVVVHPYRTHAEAIDLELDRLSAAMAQHGTIKPIWATEFSDTFQRPEDAAPLLIKMITMMSATGVKRAYWYALVDQQAFPTMGLFTGDGADKPAAEAFRLAQTKLLPLGNAVRIPVEKPMVFAYRFGGSATVIWGAPRFITINGAVQVVNAQGAVIPVPGQISDNPIILLGNVTVTFGNSPILADSLLEFDQTPWSYFTSDASGKMTKLDMMDWDWTSYLGNQWTKPLRINNDSLAPSGDGVHPNYAVLRYTAEQGGSPVVLGCISKKPVGDGVELTISHAGQKLFSAVVTDNLTINQPINKLNPGDTIDFSIGPNKTSGGDSINYRFLLANGTATPPTCR